MVGKQTSVPMDCQWILKRHLLDWFSMVANHLPNDPLVRNHCLGLALEYVSGGTSPRASRAGSGSGDDDG